MIPEISNKTDLSLSEAKLEYVELTALLNKKDGFPSGGIGWSSSVLNQIHSRLNFLRTEITDIICEVKP